MPRPQVNFRLNDMQHAALRVAAFLEDVSTAEFCRSVVVERLQALEDDPDFRQAAEARGHYLGRDDAEVVKFRRPRADGDSDS